MRQVLRLSPEDEQRLMTLFRGRILPVAQKSLRLWKKGETRPHAAGLCDSRCHNAFSQCICTVAWASALLEHWLRTMQALRGMHD